MNISKKLSIVQLILNILIFIASIILIYAAVQLYKSHNDNTYDRRDLYYYSDSYRSRKDFYLLFTIVSAGLTFILIIGILVIGIIQIVFRAKESTSGVYLASGVIGIVMFFFITFAIPLVISMIILNSIGISKKNV